MARLAIVLGDVARRASTGRLFLSGAKGDAGGMMFFHQGILVALIPPPPDPPCDLESSDVAGARRAVMAAASRAGTRTSPPFFTAGAIPDPGGPKGIRLTAGDLALDVARLVEDGAWLEERLGQAGGRLQRCIPPPAAPSAALGPHDAFLLQRADGTLDLAGMVSLVPLSRLDALRALFGLQAAGLVKCEAPGQELSDLDRFLERTSTRGIGLPRPAAASSDPPKAAPRAAVAAASIGGAKPAAAPPRPAAPPAAPPAAAPEAPRAPAASSPAAPSAVPQPATLAGTAEDARWNPAEQQERAALMEKCRGLAGQDHYAILGVEHSSNESAIRAAYYKLARLYHPDRLRKPHLEDMHTDLEGMFAFITEAYNTLSNNATRAAYDQELRAGGGTRKREGQDRVSTAREAYLRGRKAVEAGQLYEAIRLFEVAVENDPSRAEHFHHLGICQGQNPRWRKKAEENLLTAIKMNPASVASYVELARVYRKGGLERRCIEMYEQALRWDPDHREALAEIAAARDATGGSNRSRRSLFRKD